MSFLLEGLTLERSLCYVKFQRDNPPAPLSPIEAVSLESDAMNTPFADYPVVIEIPVAWGEMDAYGHVNNIVCFNYRENRKVPLPAELRRKISELENSAAPVKA
jgi:hypothetical protein